ncbi:hypothetical protein [Mucisphaera sp.]|uniref:hypothetical protein n=1 Tax=Mucisphaera sp. TaxID=2913024 RepID=UPI003D1032C0
MSGSSLWVAGGMVWLLLVATGWAALNGYMSEAGDVGVVPGVWPVGVVEGLDDGGLRTLVFLHPHCPCSVATLATVKEVWGEEGAGALVIVVVDLGEGDPGWRGTGLVRDALGVDGAEVVFDEGAEIARRFGALTSGHVLVYDGAGALVFSGGVTPWRGHVGPSGGKRSLRLLMAGAGDGTAEVTEVGASAEVYGCPLCPGSSGVGGVD